MKPMTDDEAVSLTHALFDAYETAQSTGRTPGTEYDPRGGEALLDRVHHLAAERGDARRTATTLRAENARLREALESIGERQPEGYRSPGAAVTRLAAVQSIARAALDGAR